MFASVSAHAKDVAGVRLLVEAGADKDLADKHGCTLEGRNER